MLNAVLFILIEAFLCMLGAFSKRSKATFIIIAIFIWFYVSFSFDSADIANYRYAYEHNIYVGKDRLFFIIENFFWVKGYEFNIFKIVLGTFITCVFCMGLCRYTENVSILIALCLVMPVGSFATQIRGGVAGVIVIYAVGFLKKGDKAGIIKYIVLVILSSLIHQMTFFYLILIIPWFVKDYSKYINVFRKLVIGMTVIVLMVPGIIDTVISILYSIGGNAFVLTLAFRLNQMFSEGFRATFIGFSFNALYQLVLYYCAEKSQCNYLRFAKVDLTCSEIEEIQFGRIMNCTLLALIPFYIISPQFVRVFYYILPFLYAQTINATQKTRGYCEDYSYGRNRLLLMFGVTIFVYSFGICQEPTDFLRIIDGIFKW